MSKPNPPIRSEQTLRRMWEESRKLREEVARLTALYDGHTEEADKAERVASQHRAEADKAWSVLQGFADEADDLTDMVNTKRVALRLPPLTPGEPYDPPPVPPTLTDGSLDVSGEVAGGA